MRRLIGALLFAVIGFCQLPAQQASTNDGAATKEDIQALFTTMHIREQMLNIMDVMAKQQKQMLRETLKQRIPDITEKDMDRAQSVSDQMLKNMDINGMIDDMIPVYQHHLTKADVGAMAAFYETPTGQKILREQPEMTAEAMKAVQPRMQKMMSTAMDEAEKMARDMAKEPQPANSKQ